MITKDVVRDGRVLEDLMLHNKDRSTTYELLGGALGAAHAALCGDAIAVRPDHDAEFYPLKLKHKIGFLNCKASDRTIECLLNEPRQLIVGDPSPKNIGIQESVATFFDLEDAHFGNSVFDLGFVVAHIAVHNIFDTVSMEKKLCALLQAYGQGYSLGLVQRISSAIVLYRTMSSIPYCAKFRLDDANQLTGNALRALNNEQGAEWRAYIANLATGLRPPSLAWPCAIATTTFSSDLS